MGLLTGLNLSMPRSVPSFFGALIAGVLLLVSSVAWSANWVVVERPGDMGKKGEAGSVSSLNGCYKIVLELQGATLANGVGFTMNTALVSPHRNNCSTWIDTGAGELFSVSGNQLVIEAYAATSLGDSNIKRITVQGAHGVDPIELLFGPNESAVTPGSTNNPPPPASGGSATFFPSLKNICGVQSYDTGTVLIQPCGGWSSQSGCADGFLQWNIGAAGGQALFGVATTAFMSDASVRIAYSDGQCAGAFDQLSILKLER